MKFIYLNIVHGNNFTHVAVFFNVMFPDKMFDVLYRVVYHFFINSPAGKIRREIHYMFPQQVMKTFIVEIKKTVRAESYNNLALKVVPEIYNIVYMISGKPVNVLQYQQIKTMNANLFSSQLVYFP